MILTQDQLALENSLRRILPPGVVSCWIPDGYGRAKDIIRGNHGTCFGTHPNVPVIEKFDGPNKLTDGELNIWTTPTNLTYWSEDLYGDATINREAIDKVEGDFSCRFDIGTGADAAVLFQVFSMVPSMRQKFVLWYRNSLPGKTCNYKVRDIGSNVYLDADGIWQAGSLYITLPNSVVWTPIEIEFSAHADYSSYVFFFSMDAPIAGSSSIYFDKVSIKELNYSLINPSVGWVFGGDDYVQMADDASLRPPEFSVGSWANPKAMLDWGRLAAKTGHTVDNRGWKILKHTSDSLFMSLFGIDESTENSVMVSYTPNEWTFFVFTYSYPYIRAYRNAVEVEPATNVGAWTFVPSAYPYRLGRGYVASYFTGDQALHFLANKAWSQQELNNIYLNTRSLFSPR